ncbi:SAC3 family protein B [Morus notabilis]|uniref:SAC3 family protein B n=1 Tax=Morus notabilis TaxID=981085 RepID=UPI000CED0724|nr:SAC3 family protein B [Morus notabilis]
MEDAGFGKKSGPGSATGGLVSQQAFNDARPLFSPSPSPSPQAPPFPGASPLRSPRPVVQSPPGRSDGQGSLFKNNGGQKPLPSGVTSPAFKVSRWQGGRRPNSPSFPSRGEDYSRNSGQGFPRRNNLSGENFRPPPVGTGPVRQFVPPRAHSPELGSRNNLSPEGFRPASIGAGPVRHLTPPRTQSPELAFKSNQFVEAAFRPSFAGAAPTRHLTPPRTQSPELAFKSNQFVEAAFRPSSAGAAPIRPAPSSYSLDGQPKSPRNYVSLQATQDRPSVSSYIGSYDSERSHFDVVQVTDRTRSSTPPSANEVFRESSHFPQNNAKRPSLSPSALGTDSNVNFSTHDSQASRRSLPHANNTLSEAAATNPTSFQLTKRSRSPPLNSSYQVTKGSSYDIQDADREMQAKAKRLARFKVELGEKAQSSVDATDIKISTIQHELSIVGRNKLSLEHSTELAEHFASGGAISEHEGSRSSSVIIGLCTDMCPESERISRERKGDLDQFERLDGDRNQTNKYLAVKKYTRTAEREANLIRPMPVLQKTIDYLLNLLDQPYNNRFLGIYNFLWDRMRAIRMDLRMQHIFDQGAITMLEQMIRLHIIAMHELCEYSRGEGFSEGFDAHLNIEQMNKTSVELFQLYDDHRKKGISIPTEREFRGYYALLKLDKHPGYIVEPAELSLDLAKMTPEIRQTKEVLFARNVARACRTGNFIAFFRLARKASYLQACLMHAHFAKLRTQALASLHAGLQNNQGLPVSHVAKWLAMEDEDMESLLEYHGFLIKVFEEPYMVKEGPFLNSDKDYPTRCSKLVDLKKSGLIFEDVSLSTQVISPTKAPDKIQMTKTTDKELKVFPSDEKERSFQNTSSVEVFSPVHAVDEEMADYEVVPSPKEPKKMQPIAEISIFSQQRKDEHQLPGFYPLSWDSSLSKPLPSKVSIEEKPNYDSSFSISPQIYMHSDRKEMSLQLVSKTTLQDRLPDIPYTHTVENPVPQDIVDELEDEEPSDVLQEIENEDVMADYQREEIAEAKLKLILRSWKRRASRKRELRQQRQLAANAALDSLPLGLLFQPKQDPPSTAEEFDIDHVLRERYSKHEQSWSRLNVSKEIAGILSRRNPDAKCLSWKIIVCSPNPEEAEMGECSQTAHSQMGSWLLSKLISSSKADDDLVISYPGLSIWKKWIPGQSFTDMTCCLSVVKEANFNNLTDTVSGANSVLFLTSDSIPWNFQKAQLHKLLKSIPSGSCLPLLILSGSFKDEFSDPSSIIVDELGLHDMDKSRISIFLVVSLTKNQQVESLDGFFSDSRLREGLQWLASESPPQLVLHCVNTRELVLTHLNPSLEALDRMKDNEVDPNDCVRAFNEALDQSLVDVDTAAKANHISWPCPEITLLEAFTYEHRFVEGCMPENGWSSVEKIEPLMSALQDCKLPLFPDDLSYLAKGSDVGGAIEIQRVEFRESLIRYLTESNILMGDALAIKEASIMLQRSRLELRSSCFHIVPNWVMIFKRIFNWRLMGIASGPLSSAYVLERPDVTRAFGDLDVLGVEGSGLSPYHLNQPSLDEMIEVSYALPFYRSNYQPLPEANQVVPELASNDEAQEAVTASDFIENDSVIDWDRGTIIADNVVREVTVARKVDDETDKLSKLLEKCNMLQNMIDDKLSVYF